MHETCYVTCNVKLVCTCTIRHNEQVSSDCATHMVRPFGYSAVTQLDQRPTLQQICCRKC